jgi:hypothetical protein
MSGLLAISEIQYWVFERILPAPVRSSRNSVVVSPPKERVDNKIPNVNSIEAGNQVGQSLGFSNCERSSDDGYLVEPIINGRGGGRVLELNIALFSRAPHSEGIIRLLVTASSASG